MSEIKGIIDNSTEPVVVLTDDKVTLRGNVKIFGVLDVGLVKTTEIIADQRYEKRFLSFVPPEGTDLAGTGLIWADKTQNKQFVYRSEPNRFFVSEHLEFPADKCILSEGTPLLSYKSLGATITESNLTKIGTLDNLSVGGDINFSDTVYFNSSTGRFSIGLKESNGLFSIYDEYYGVEFIVQGTESGNAKLGTFNNKGLELITGDTTRLTISATGLITIGQESNQVVLNGKVGINVKNPKESLEVAGNIKFAGKLFASSDSPPSDGVYQKGDIVWNSEPWPSKYVGWICTVGGTPGTWAPFGLIV